MGSFFGSPPLTADEALKILRDNLEKQEKYLLAIGSWHIEHKETASILARFGIDIGLMTEEQKKIEPAVKNELARNQAATNKVVGEIGGAINKVVVDTGKAVRNEVLSEMRSDRGRLDNMAASINEVLAAIRKGGPLFSDLRASLSAQGEVMAEYSTDLGKTKKENLRLYEEVKRVKKALSVAEKRILDLEQDKLFPEPSPMEPYELFDGETGEQILVVPQQKPAPVKAPQNVEATPKETSELDEMRVRIETITSKVESLAASKQPQEPPAPAPASTGSAPAETTPVISAPPAPAMAVQASNGYVPKAEDILSYPNAAQLGKKSLLLLQKLASIMEGKTPPIFTRENIDEWLDITTVRTGDRYVSEWQKLGFIEKKGKSVYGFIPPPTATTTATPTQPQEGSQPAV